MYNINNDIIVTIHKDEKDTINHIKNSPNFITSSYYHEYNSFVKYDYGPINISNIIKFINFIDDIINNNKNKSKVIEYYVYETDKKYDLLNCFFLFGCYLIHKHNYSVPEILFNFTPFFDDIVHYYTDCITNDGGYVITFKDCLNTFYFITKNNIINIETFDIDEYDKLINFKNIDMTIILNKFIAMSCPSNYNIQNTIDILKEKNVKKIIRLNQKNYDTQLFTDNDIKIYDLYFEDMKTPSINIIKKFFNIVNKTNFEELIAIHCHAGLGRTGLLICLWLINKYNFTPNNAIVFMRLMRPCSIMNNQGIFIESYNYISKYI